LLKRVDREQWKEDLGRGRLGERGREKVNSKNHSCIRGFEKCCEGFTQIRKKISSQSYSNISGKRKVESGFSEYKNICVNLRDLREKREKCSGDMGTEWTEIPKLTNHRLTNPQLPIHRIKL
jgi:hypothetical protein